jgi:uncharacterized protein (TIGR00297 family)
MSFFSITIADLYYSIIFLALLFVLLFSIDYLYKKQVFSHFFLRKFVHIIVGVMVVLASFFLESSVPIIVISILFALINFISIQKKKFTSIHGEDKSFGTVYYPLAILALTVLFWDKYLVLFQTTTLIMAISDAMAAIVGVKYGKSKYQLIKDNKSIAGSSAMFISTFVVVFLMLILNIEISLIQLLIISISIGAVSVASELMSSNGSDNLTVPLFSALFLFVFITDSNIFYQLVLGIVLSFVLAFISGKLKYLSNSGAVATFLLGSVVFGLGGIPYVIPILAFFILSSLLSLFGKKGKTSVEKSYEKTSTRDYAQVIANGGVAGIIVILGYFYPNPINYIVYLSVVAASTADTWATEIGFFSNKLPRLITNFKAVSKGTSGAISILGTFAAMLGSFIIVLTGILAGGENTIQNNYFFYIFVVVASGTAACFCDSFLGATVQAQFKCSECDKITEKNVHCGKESILQSGNKKIRNDAVNLLASLFSIIVSIVIIGLINWK